MIASHEPVLIGVDGGGTKTVCVLVRGARLLGIGMSGPANVCTHADSASAAVEAACQAARAEAGIESPADAACLGVAGFFACRAPEGPQALLAGVVPARRVRVISDMESGFLGSTLGKPGVVLVAGTGSAAYGGSADGRRARASGWGYLLADEGSAFWIGLQAARAALRAFDGRGPDTQLLHRLLERFGITDPEELEGAVYGMPQVSTGIATLATVVTDAAAAGDGPAAAILVEAGAHLADAAVAVLRRLGLMVEPAPVVTVGGVLRDSGGPVVAALRSALVRLAPSAFLADPILPPVGGALLQAWWDAQADLSSQSATGTPDRDVEAVAAGWAAELNARVPR